MKRIFLILGIGTILLSGCMLISDNGTKEKYKPPFVFIEQYDFQNRPVTSVYIDEKGTEFIGTWEGLAYYTKSGNEPVYVETGLSRKCRVIKEYNGVFYAAFERNRVMTSTNGEDWQVTIEPGGSLYDLVVLKSGRLVVGGEKGIYYKDTGSENAIKVEFFFASSFITNSIDHLLETSQGALLAGTHDGIYRSSDEGITWEKVSQNISKHNDEISMLFERKDGTLLAGYGNGNLMFSSKDDGKTWISYRLPENHPQKMIESEGMEYLLLNGEIWYRRNNEQSFKNMKVREKWNRFRTETDLISIDDFFVRNDKIILYQNTYPNAVYFGRKNIEADVWNKVN